MDGNWRIQIKVEDRQNLINKIIYTLQKHVSDLKNTNMNELCKLAHHFEAKVYQSASNEQDYFRRISSKLLMLERNNVAIGEYEHSSAVKLPTANTIDAKLIGSKEELDAVHVKLQKLKEKYLLKLIGIDNMLLRRYQQALPPELYKLKRYKELAQGMISYLTLAKDQIPREVTQGRILPLEKNIVLLLELFKSCRPTHQQQSLSLPKQIERQQQLEQEVKLASMTEVSTHEQQMAGKLPQQEANIKHVSRSVLGTIVKPDDVREMGPPRFPIKLQPHSTGISDYQFKVPLSETANRLLATSMEMQQQQKFLQADRAQESWLLNQHDALQRHKFNEQVIMAQFQKSMVKHEGQDLTGEFKMKQADLQQLKQRQSFPQKQQALRVDLSHSRSSPQDLLDNLPVGRRQQGIEIGSKRVVVTDGKCGLQTLASLPDYVTSSSLGPLSLVQDVDSQSNMPKLICATNSEIGEYTESSWTADSRLSTSDVTSPPFLTLKTERTSEQLTTEYNVPSVLIESCSSRTNIENPLKRLISKIDAGSPSALKSAVEDIFAAVNCLDMFTTSEPDHSSLSAGGGEDLVLATKFGSKMPLASVDKNKKRRIRQYSSIPMSSSLDGNLDNSFSTSAFLGSLGAGSLRDEVKCKQNFEVHLALKREIIEINKQLITTYLEIDEIGTETTAADCKEGILVSCIYSGITSNYTGACSQISSWNGKMQLPPLKLIIPPSYPHSSPILPSDSSINSSHPVAVAARDDFVQTAKSLASPVSLGTLAKTWDTSAHNAVINIMVSVNGGSFSSVFGVWQSCTMP